MRFVLHDEDGPIRKCATLDEARYWMRIRPEWRLVALPRARKPKMDFSALPEAPF